MTAARYDARMVLHNHFRPPMSDRRDWHSFHNGWATFLAAQLNTALPTDYFAEPNVQYGIEIDVAVVGGDDEASPMALAWLPPPAPESAPITAAEAIVEISIFDRSAGRTLAGAIELVSPSNKDRPASRDAFTSKCAAYVQQGVGLVTVDVVTSRGGDLDTELRARLGIAPPKASADALYAAAYRLVERDDQPMLDLWREPLAVGRALPTLPLWLRGGLCLPVELGATYERTCRELRLLPAA